MARNPLTFGPKPPFKVQEKQSAPGVDKEMDPPPDHGLESYTGRNRLTDRVALVTGGDSGIGRAVAILFAKEGADVAFTYLPEEEADAKLTIEAITGQGRKAHAMVFDLAQEANANKAVEETVAQFGKLDIVVNNAAFQRTHEKLEEIAYDEFAETFKINVFATLPLQKLRKSTSNQGV